MTYYGSQHLVRKAFPEAEFLQFDMRRAEQEIETYVSQYNWGENIDLILLAGSPWIGVGDNTKIRMVKQAKDRWPDARKIALGIGSFLSWTRMREKNYDEVEHEFLRDFDTVIVRDKLAEDILRSVGISCSYMKDTSIYSYFKLPNSSFNNSRPALIYYDPLENDVFDHLPKEIWHEYIDYQLRWAKYYEADIYVVSSGDKSSCMKKGFEARFVTDIDWLARRLASSKLVLSGRVHQAILAKICGAKKVMLLPVDSRYLTTLGLGIQIIQPKKIGKYVFDATDSLGSFSLKKLRAGSYEKDIVKHIRRVIC